MNKYKLKIFKKVESELITEIERLKAVLFQKPATEFLQVQKEFAQLLEDNKGEKRLTQDFMKKVDDLAEREERAKKAMKKDLAIDREKIGNELIDIEFELEEVKREIYFIERSMSKV